MAASWVEVPAGSDFTLANLPFGVADDGRVVVAIGEEAFDLTAATAAGLLQGTGVDDTVFAARSLNALIGLGRAAVTAVRDRVGELLSGTRDDRVAEMLVLQSALQMALPIEVSDYADFYSSVHHATNLGRLFRPDAEPLMPNWLHLPVGYHGRAGTVVVSGTDVVRPRGLVLVDGEPVDAACAALDIELEIGSVVGAPSSIGHAVPIDAAGDHIAGLVLLNDWSARDIQSYEYQPLGPFLGKSFATSISPWLVTLDALEPFLVMPPAQSPVPAAYLQAREPWGIAIELEVLLETAAMRSAGIAPVVVSRTEFGSMYWTIAQQLAHLTANGASLRAGDLLGSGTVSGPDAATQAGSFIELTWRGSRPIELPAGETRGFLADGDRVILRGGCGEGDDRVGFGMVDGTIVPARPRI